MRRRIFFFLILIWINIFSFSLFAVPANPEPVEVELPDGTTAVYVLKGDERVNWMQSEDGYTLLYNQDKFLVYADQDREGNLVPSVYRYRKTQLRSSEENQFLSDIPKDLRYSKSQIQMLSQIWNMTELTITQHPVLGEKKALCVLIGFPDKPFVKTREQFEALMNQAGYSDGGARGSVKDFYRENSYGKMDLTVTVVGPYEAPNICSYYASDKRYQEFAKMAAEAADPNVDFNEFANEKGSLENFHIIFAGYGDESAGGTGQQIWSHKWELTAPIYLDGVRIFTYSCSPELRGRTGSTITSIGVICHEMCHVWGASDYYDTDYGSSGGEYPGTGNWDLMGNGSWNNSGNSPAHINMFQKILYGWVDPVELTSGTKITDMPNSTENPVAYIIRPSNNNEMYVLENRQRLRFDSNVPGNGLLIYHIHNSASSGKVDNTRHPQQAYVVSSSITSSLYAIPTAARNSYGSINSSRTPFTNAAGRNEFSGNSIPQMFYWSGSSGVPVTDKPITEITQANGLLSFKFRGGNMEQYVPAKNLTAVLKEDTLRLEWQIADDNFSNYVYDLYRNDELIQANIKETFFLDTLTVAGVYNYCVVTSVYGQELESACTSLTYIQILEQPQGGEVCIGKEFILQLDATPENLFYQWYKDDELIEGANENTYIISKFAESDVGIYYVIVSDESGNDQKQSDFVALIKDNSAICCVGIDKIISENIVDVTIADLNGRQVFTADKIDFSEITSIVNSSSWDKGVYIVRIRTANGQKVYKLIKT
jgi:M6 family metalloprotease-like protein